MPFVEVELSWFGMLEGSRATAEARNTKCYFPAAVIGSRISAGTGDLQTLEATFLQDDSAEEQFARSTLTVSDLGSIPILLANP